MIKMENEFNKNNLQQVEGMLFDYTSMGPDELREYLMKRLPAGVLPEQVDVLIGNDGKWRWHLRPENIKDEETRKEYENERKIWPRR